jgi:hypothetical protein
MSTDLQEIIAESTIRAFNAGYLQGKTEGYAAGVQLALKAAKFVAFGHSDFESDILALSDFEEEVKSA